MSKKSWSDVSNWPHSNSQMILATDAAEGYVLFLLDLSSAFMADYFQYFETWKESLTQLLTGWFLISLSALECSISSADNLNCGVLLCSNGGRVQFWICMLLPGQIIHCQISFHCKNTHSYCWDITKSSAYKKKQKQKKHWPGLICLFLWI